MWQQVLHGLFAEGGILRVRALALYALVGSWCVAFLRGDVEADLFAVTVTLAASFYFAIRNTDRSN